MSRIDVQPVQAVEVSPGLYEFREGAASELRPGLFNVYPKKRATRPVSPPHTPIAVTLASSTDSAKTIAFGRRGHGWYVQGLDGWDELSARKGRTASFALRHGGASVEHDLRESISGVLRVRYRGTAKEVAEANSALLSLATGPLTLSVTDHDETTRQREVVVEEVQVRDRRIPDTLLTAAIVWTSPDPRRYSAVTPTAAKVACHNWGTAPTSPVLELLGPVVGSTTVTEVETGRALQFSGSVPAGRVLRIDPSLGIATVDGVPSLGLRRMEWPSIPPGQARSYVASSGTLTVLHRSGWW